MIELRLGWTVRCFDLTVQLEQTRFDLGLANLKILDVSVELRVELMPVVGVKSEGEPIDDLIDVVDGVDLGMSLFRP